VWPLEPVVRVDAHRRARRRAWPPAWRTSRQDRERDGVLEPVRVDDAGLLEGDVVGLVVLVVLLGSVGVVAVVVGAVGVVVVIEVGAVEVVVVVLGSVGVVAGGAVVVVATVPVVVVESSAVVVVGGAVAVCGPVAPVAAGVGDAASAVARHSARTPGTVTASRTAVTMPAPGRRRHHSACREKRCIARVARLARPGKSEQ
jgi:hypothetical protein